MTGSSTASRRVTGSQDARVKTVSAIAGCDGELGCDGEFHRCAACDGEVYGETQLNNKDLNIQERFTMQQGVVLFGYFFDF